MASKTMENKHGREKIFTCGVPCVVLVIMVAMCPPGDSNHAKLFFVLIEIFTKITKPCQSFSTRVT